MSINQVTKLVFLGTGPSSGVPNLHCLATKRCKNCLNAKNNRTNVSLLLECKNSLLLIDCTKDFYSQYKNYLMKKIKKDMENNDGKNLKKKDEHINNTDVKEYKKSTELECSKKIEDKKDEHRTNTDVKDYEKSTKLESSKKIEDEKDYERCNKQSDIKTDRDCERIHIDANNEKNNYIYDQNINSPTILLTHEHADAILGLDYIRQMTPRTSVTNLYGDKKTNKYLKTHFNYLFYKSTQNTAYNGALKFNEVESNKLMLVDGLEILPFHVEHGKDFVALAFYIQNKILYVSDCSNFDTVPDLEIDILIAECTTYDKFAFGHSNFFDVLRLIERIKPRKTYLIGMSHLIDYDEMVIEVKKYPYNIQIAYDGLEVELQ